MYSSLFCRLYDDFGWNEYPRVFAEQLLRWLSARGAEVRSALDLGCGTGVLCEALHAAGIETLGVDRSPEMIDIARSRAPALRYAVMDFVDQRPEGAFDLVTCTGDAINHIPALSDVGRAFGNAFAALNPGGFLVFDLLNSAEIAPGEPFEAEYGPSGRVRFLTELSPEGRVTLRIDLFQGEQTVFSEIIREQLYDVDAVCRLLEETGFALLQRADRLLESDHHGTTWFICAQKPGH